MTCTDMTYMAHNDVTHMTHTDMTHKDTTRRTHDHITRTFTAVTRLIDACGTPYSYLTCPMHT